MQPHDLIWVGAAIIAAACQTSRSAFQKRLIPDMGQYAAAYTRFIMALPFTFGLWVLYLFIESKQPLEISQTALMYCLLGSFFQVVFTIALMAAFTKKSFATGTAFSKIDVILAGFIEIFFLGIVFSHLTGLGFILASISVLFLSFAKTSNNIFKTFHALISSFVSLGSLYGLLAGIAITLAQVFFRLSMLSLEGDVLNKSLTISVLSLTIQTICFGLYLYVYHREQLFRITQNLSDCVIVGISGTGATIGWFIGFALATVAEVKAVGQIELVFSMLVSLLMFREKIKINELIGMLLLMVSIYLVLADKIW